jgi:hypothetical protein
MSLAVLNEAFTELRRLSIAGVRFSKGDFRLQSLAGKLKEVGQKAPVFAKLAELTDELTRVEEQDAPEKFLALTTLVTAILYTQGKVGAEGKMDVVHSDGFPVNTVVSGRILKQVTEALQGSMPGRMQILNDAIERDVFKDSRLFLPSLKALSESYWEVADLIGEKVLPSYTPYSLPYLIKEYNVKGKRPDAWRLKLMAECEPEKILSLCQTAFDDGSKEVKLAALEVLSKNRVGLSMVIEQCSSKNDNIRQEAFEALASFNGVEVETVLKEALHGKQCFVAARSLKAVLGKGADEYFENFFQITFDAISGKEVPSQTLETLSAVLAKISPNFSQNFLKYLIKLFNKRSFLNSLKGEEKNSVGGKDILQTITDMLASRDEVEVVKLFETCVGDSSVHLTNVAFTVCFRNLEPERLFELFSPIFRTASTAQKNKIISQMKEGLSRGNKPLLSEKWCDLADEFDLLDLYSMVALSGNKQALKKLPEKLSLAKERSQRVNIISALLQVEHETGFQLALEELKALAKTYGEWQAGRRIIDSFNQEQLELSKEFIPQFADSDGNYLLERIFNLNK